MDKHFCKVKGVFVRLDDLIDKIQSDHTQQHHKLDEPLPISVFNVQGQSSTELDGQFIHSQLLIDCLIRMKPSSNEKQELVNFCKKQYKIDTEILDIKEFQSNYSPERSIWWYTKDSFVYKLLNKALRAQNIEILYLFRFIIRDLGQELENNKCSSFVRVYRAQNMSKEEIEKLNNAIGEYISMNTFFSTSLNPKQARKFLSNDRSDDIERVFFEIEANPQLENIKPFSNITSLSYYQEEEEILFMVGSIFRLISMKQDKNGIWNIQMVLCSDNNHQLKPLFQYMKNELGNKEIDLNTFGRVLCDMGKFNDAEKYLLLYLKQLSNDDSDISHCYHTLGVVKSSKGDYNSSLEYHNKSLEILMRTLKADDPNIAASHNSIANVYRKKGDFTRALESFEKALKIRKQAFGEDHPDVASCLNNMGILYEKQMKYSDALKFYEKALTIFKKHCPDDHAHLGALHNNIGNIYQLLYQYDEALKHYNSSLKIKSKSLTPQHIDMANTLRNIGLVHEKKRDFQQALFNLNKAAKIYCDSLSETHPDVVQIKEDVERVSSMLD